MRVLERLGYLDCDSRSVVMCAEPFCRVNHAGSDANSTALASGCSSVAKPIPAGTEITQAYDYDLVLSILWKFPELRSELPAEMLEDEDFLFSPVDAHPAVAAFLKRF